MSISPATQNTRVIDSIGQVEYNANTKKASVKVTIGEKTYTIRSENHSSASDAQSALSNEEIVKMMTCAQMVGLGVQGSTTSKVEISNGKLIAYKKNGSSPKEYSLTRNFSGAVDSLKESRVSHLQGKMSRYQTALAQLNSKTLPATIDPSLFKGNPKAKEAVKICQAKIAKYNSKLSIVGNTLSYNGKQSPVKTLNTSKKRSKPANVSSKNLQLFEKLRKDCKANNKAPFPLLKEMLGGKNIENEYLEAIKYFSQTDQEFANDLLDNLGGYFKLGDISDSFYHKGIDAFIHSGFDMSRLINLSFQRELAGEIIKHEEVKNYLTIRGVAGELEVSQHKHTHSTKHFVINGHQINLHGGRFGEAHMILSNSLTSFANSTTNSAYRKLALQANSVMNKSKDLANTSKNDLKQAINSNSPQLFKGGYNGHAVSILIKGNKMIVCNRGAGATGGINAPGYTVYTFNGSKVPLKALELMTAKTEGEYLSNLQKLNKLPRANAQNIKLPGQKGGSCWLMNTTPIIEGLSLINGNSISESSKFYKEFLNHHREKVLVDYNTLRKQENYQNKQFNELIRYALNKTTNPIWGKIRSNSPAAREILS